MKRTLLLFAAVLAMAAPADAQGGLKKKVLDLFSAPVHPIIKSVGPGGGHGPGIGVKPKMRANEPWSIHADAVFTLPNRYWQAEASYIYTRESVHAQVYGRARHMTRLDFYGIGPDAPLDARTTFTFDDRTIGGLMSVPFNSAPPRESVRADPPRRGPAAPGVVPDSGWLARGA